MNRMYIYMYIIYYIFTHAFYLIRLQIYLSLCLRRPTGPYRSRIMSAARSTWSEACLTESTTTIITWSASFGTDPTEHCISTDGEFSGNIFQVSYPNVIYNMFLRCYYYHYYYTTGNAPNVNHSEVMNHRLAWSSLVVTEPSTSQNMLCVRVCTALSVIYYSGPSR